MRSARLASLLFALTLPLGCGDDKKTTPDAAGTGGVTGTGGSTGTGGGGAATGGSTGTGGSAGTGGVGMPADGGTADAAAPIEAGVTADSGAAGDGPAGDVAATGAMSFFVTSEPIGKGGNLGGLMGADKHCDKLAKAANSQKKQWVAYLSNMAPAVNARDRIGTGPWYNQKGQLFATSVDKLHPMIDPAMRAAYVAAKPADELFLDEKGARIPGNTHDVLTGSDGQGKVVANKTCKDWTSEAKGGVGDVAVLGHSDTPANTMFSPSWNSAHDSQGCGQADLVPTGGIGRLYCFATD